MVSLKLKKLLKASGKPVDLSSRLFHYITILCMLIVVCVGIWRFPIHTCRSLSSRPLAVIIVLCTQRCWPYFRV